MRLPALTDDRGFTLIEVMVTMVILLIGLLGTFQLIDVANSRGAGNRAREGATNLAREILEQTRTIPYAQVSTASPVDALLQELAGLSDDNASLPGWQISRRGFAYRVVVTACAFDDPKDGGGARDASAASFCSDSASVDTADSQPQDLKRVTAAVSFTERGRTTTVRMTGTLNSSGRAVGMPVTDLRVTNPVLSQPTQPLITSSSVGSLTFRATVPATASGAVWLLDGQAMSPAPVRAANGTDWTFPWSIAGVSDGVYQVSVQALDAVGLPGPPRTITVRLLRLTPAAPSGVTGGFNDVYRDGSNTPVVELQWYANSERNVEGYRVYNPSGQLVCETARIIDTKCIDFSPPAQTASNLTYTVRALFRDVNDNLQQGPPAPFTLQTSLLQRFGFRATTANTLTKCGGASTRRDMVSGYGGYPRACSREARSPSARTRTRQETRSRPEPPP
jgi:prepilin-type N-terminal cleavage/methylation domain-containing protein